MTAEAAAVRDETIEVWDGRLRLHVKIAGDGPRLLYFHPLHGLTWTPLLDRLAQGDPDPARRRTALLYAARLHERAGNAGAAADRYRQLLGLWPEHAAARGR